MVNKYKLFDESGALVNKIVASEEMVILVCAENNYTYELIEDPIIPPEPVNDPITDLQELTMDQECRLILIELGILEV